MLGTHVALEIFCMSLLHVCVRVCILIVSISIFAIGIAIIIFGTRCKNFKLSVFFKQKFYVILRTFYGIFVTLRNACREREEREVDIREFQRDSEARS